jgi:hypothetical protein
MPVLSMSPELLASSLAGPHFMSRKIHLRDVFPARFHCFRCCEYTSHQAKIWRFLAFEEGNSKEKKK